MKLQKTEISQDLLKKEFVTVIISGQLFGIPVVQVREILNRQIITRIPLAPKEIAGSLNLRGRIVTAINLHSLLNLSYYLDDLPAINVVVENKGELYSLMIESVLDVIRISPHSIETTPLTLDETWRKISSGVVQHEGKIMIIMNIEALLNFDIRL